MSDDPTMSCEFEDIFNEHGIDFLSHIKSFPEDKRIAASRWWIDKVNRISLLSRDPPEQYDDIIIRLKRGEQLDNELILKLLKSMKRPAEPTSLQQDKMHTLEELYWPLQWESSPKKKFATIIKEYLVEMEPSNAWQAKLKAMFIIRSLDKNNILIEKVNSHGLNMAYKKVHEEAVKYGYITPTSKK